MLRSLNFTAIASGRRRWPAHASQVAGSASASCHHASSPVCSTSKPCELHARAVAALAPTVARVVREQPRIERLEAAPAARARALGREELAVAGVARRRRVVAASAALAALADLRGRAPARLLRAAAVRALAARSFAASVVTPSASGLTSRTLTMLRPSLQRLRERVGELVRGGRAHVDLRDRQLDVVLLETVEPRPALRRRRRRRRRAASRSRGSTPSRRARCSSPCGRSRAARAARCACRGSAS